MASGQLLLWQFRERTRGVGPFGGRGGEMHIEITQILATTKCSHHLCNSHPSSKGEKLPRLQQKATAKLTDCIHVHTAGSRAICTACWAQMVISKISNLAWMPTYCTDVLN